MANDLERAARDALIYLEDVIPSSLVTMSLRAALDAPPQSRTRDQYAAAIWEARDDPAHHRPGMTWVHLLECLETNPAQYTSDYERTLRQADAAMKLSEPAPHLVLALHVALERPTHDPVRTHLWRIVQGTATPADWNVIKRAAPKRD